MTATSQAVRFGICTDQNLSFDTLVERWQYFEELGFDSAWDCDHFNQTSNETGPYFETAPASLHALRFEDGGLTVARLNDISHLADAPN